jgi:5-methylcytosine-specific restriction enzyme subunit McrC
VLEIRPRLGIETIANWAGAALNLHVLPKAGEHHGTSALIAELVAATWRASLIEAYRHGPPGLRANTPYHGTSIRGRLDVPGTLQLRASRTPQIASIERAKRVVNPVSRVIVVADRILHSRLKHRPGWRGDRLEELLAHLRGAVGNRPTMPTRRELDRVRYTPTTQPFRRVAELSWQIASNRGIRSSATGERAEGLLIDVAELWELFLVHCARRAFGSAAVTHGTQLNRGRPLLHSLSRPNLTWGRLYPDILIGPVEEPTLVLDAKYKPLTGGNPVAREDLYQLTTYLIANSARKLPVGMLGYPRLIEQGSLCAAETEGPWETPLGHRVRFDRMPLKTAECIDFLRKTLSTESPGALAGGPLRG